MVEMDPDKINDHDRQIEARILKEGQDYAARNQRSKAENKGRAESRARIKELGMDTNAYATAIRLIKDKTPEELKAWRRDFELTLKIMGSKQKELFPEEQLRAEKRLERQRDAAAKKGRSKDELDAKTDSDPRSDPNAGGAQIDIEQAIRERQEREQAEGETILAGKSSVWRGGFNAHGQGAERKANPYIEGSSEAREWFAGFEAATQRAFEAAEPPIPDAPADPVVEDGETFNQGAGKPESQSTKAARKRAAAKVP